MRPRRQGWLTSSLVSIVAIATVFLTLAALRRPTTAGVWKNKASRDLATGAARGRSPGTGIRSGTSLEEGWRTVFREIFTDDITSCWSITDGDGAPSYGWGTSVYTHVVGGRSAWCAGSLTGTSHYTDDMDAWLISQPVELNALGERIWDAEISFEWWLEADRGLEGSAATGTTGGLRMAASPPSSGDWFGWGVVREVSGAGSGWEPAGSWTYVSGATSGWTRGWLPLADLLGEPQGLTGTVRIGFHFVSDDDRRVGRGAFIDDVAIRVNRGHRVALPLVAGHRGACGPVEDLLVNGGFESDWAEEASHWVKVFPVDGEPYLTEKGEFHTPPGWVAWYRHDPGTWDQPELGDIRKVHVPYRVRSGEKAARLFTFYRSHDAGLMQQVSVVPGSRLTLTGYAHAWSNHPFSGHGNCADDGHCSAGVGWGGHFLLPEEVPPPTGDPWNDAVGNFSFIVGIDPTGGADPFADSVVWGFEAFIYNVYHKVPQVRATAQGQTATVFLRSRARWPLKHNDAYWDDVALLGIREGTDPTPQPAPWTYNVISTGSKIGVHALRSNGVAGFSQELTDAGARFSVIKAVDDFGWLAEVAAQSPDSIVIGRRVWSMEGCGGVEGWDDDDIAYWAAEAIERILNTLDANPGLDDTIDYWEPYNEPDPPGPEGYAALAELQKVTMDTAEHHGLRLALFSLNAGTPEWDEMVAMVETGVFARARAGGHILALHEGTFTTHDPTQYWGDKIPPQDEVPDVNGAGALNFRYRYLYHLLKASDQIIPLVVSEWYCGDEQSAATETLVGALTWYDEELSEDYFVWGVCPFTLGPTGQWSHTDFERVYPGAVDHMIQIRDRQNALPPF